MHIPVTDQQIEAFERDGAVCLRKAFSPEWIERLRAGVSKDIATPGPLHTVQQGAGEEGFFLTDFCMAQRLTEFRDFVVSSPAAAIAGQIMRASRVSFFYDAMWVKSQSTPKRTRWHQDQPYYPVNGDQFCATWIPLDTVTEEVCLELVRGSHRWGRWFSPELTRKGQDLYHAVERRFERLPDIQAAREDYDIVSWAMQPGDCIVFHALTVHGAPGNASEERWRRAVSMFWMGDDAVYASPPRQGATVVRGARTRARPTDRVRLLPAGVADPARGRSRQQRSILRPGAAHQHLKVCGQKFATNPGTS